jgi:hypothetical protein
MKLAWSGHMPPMLVPRIKNVKLIAAGNGSATDGEPVCFSLHSKVVKYCIFTTFSHVMHIVIRS